jgi:hypothetical protein
MDENLENADSTNGEEIVEPETDEPTEVGLPADPIEVEPQDEPEEDVQALRQKNQELYEQLRKAKGFKRDANGKWVKPEPKGEVKPVKDSDITLTELHSLLKANVPEEDTNEVRLYARSHDISITDALKMEEVKSLLRTKAEIRRTAEAAATSGGRRGTLKQTGEELLEKARKGEADIVKNATDIAKARIEARRAERGIGQQR